MSLLDKCSNQIAIRAFVSEEYILAGLSFLTARTWHTFFRTPVYTGRSCRERGNANQHFTIRALDFQAYILFFALETLLAVLARFAPPFWRVRRCRISI